MYTRKIISLNIFRWNFLTRNGIEFRSNFSGHIFPGTFSRTHSGRIGEYQAKKMQTSRTFSLSYKYDGYTLILIMWIRYRNWLWDVNLLVMNMSTPNFTQSSKSALPYRVVGDKCSYHSAKRTCRPGHPISNEIPQSFLPELKSEGRSWSLNESISGKFMAPRTCSSKTRIAF